jgi:hypothetical protein
MAARVLSSESAEAGRSSAWSVLGIVGDQRLVALAQQRLAGAEDPVRRSPTASVSP